MKQCIALSMLLFFAKASFAQKQVEDTAEMCRILREIQTADQLYRSGPVLGGSFGSTSAASQIEIDSIWALQIEIDNRNTERLIILTKEYGWLSDERINCSDLNIWIIFRHAQKKYFDEVSALIEKEFKSGRLSKWHYNLIQNHLNGRPR